MTKDKYPIVMIILIILWVVAMGKAAKQFTENQTKQTISKTKQTISKTK